MRTARKRHGPHVNAKVRDALREIVRGKMVKRALHDLIHQGTDLTSEFVEELAALGYVPVTVAQVDVRPGERVPAFFLENGVAYFGWVFWEQFTSSRLRKLFGSVVKNAKGDWQIQIPATRTTLVYANQALKIEMDIDHPPEF